MWASSSDEEEEKVPKVEKASVKVAKSSTKVAKSSPKVPREGPSTQPDISQFEKLKISKSNTDDEEIQSLAARFHPRKLDIPQKEEILPSKHTSDVQPASRLHPRKLDNPQKEEIPPKHTSDVQPPGSRFHPRKDSSSDPPTKVKPNSPTVQYLDSHREKEELQNNAEITTSALKESRWADEPSSPSKQKSNIRNKTKSDKPDIFPKGPRNTTPIHEDGKRNASPRGFQQQPVVHEVSKFANERERNRLKKLTAAQLDWDRNEQQQQQQQQQQRQQHQHQHQHQQQHQHPHQQQQQQQPRQKQEQSKTSSRKQESSIPSNSERQAPPKPALTKEEIKKAEEDIARVISGGINWADELDDF